jgi:uncharacterized lipoprotein YddW (UPF0748 family)
MPAFELGAWSHQVRDFGGERDVKKHVERLSRAGFELLIPCVKNPPGAVDFLSEKADMTEGYPSWDPLRVLIDACHEREIKVHPWFCVFPEGDASRLLRAHPEYRAKFKAEMAWACACRPEVQDYALGLYRELAEGYEPDGLHLDYIRTGGQCRCEYCTEEMAAQGVEIAEVSPRDAAFEVWTEWRTSRITEFVGQLHGFASGRGIEVSAAVFAGYPDSIPTQGQDWVRWAELGIVDYLVPMNYTNSLRIFAARTVCHLALVGGRVPLLEGIGKRSSASQLGGEELASQVKAARAAGASGAVIFQYRDIADDELGTLRETR